MAPLAIVHLLGAGLHFDAAGAHVHQQIQETLQQLHGEEVHPGPALSGSLHSSVAENQQAVGLCGAEVEGDGSGLFAVPAGKSDVGSWSVEADGVQSRHVLAAEGQVSLQADLGVTQLGQMGELQFELVVGVHHLGER
uniref:Uncharacterized protein n=1 Tax=Astyanax mexicanus TaxID=7994 RepID=A0A3B1IWX2_ASTMX